MLNSATINDPINPMVRDMSSGPVKASLVFSMSSPVAASMVGTARKKENSTAVFRFVPKNNALMMVAADLETPGITARD